jgi:hypothetical protein
MYRIGGFAANVGRYRIVLQLGLLAIGLLAMTFGGGAPDCSPDGGAGC